MREAPSKVEVAAMYFYHAEYAYQALGAVRFYERLTLAQKKLMAQMVREIEEADDA